MFILLLTMVLLWFEPFFWLGLFLALCQLELPWPFLSLYPHVKQYASGSHQDGHSPLFSVLLVLLLG